MAWAGAGRSGVERRVVGSEFRGRRVELVDPDVVGAEVVYERETILGGDDGAMRVRSGLTPGIGTVTGELEQGVCIGKVAIRGNLEGEDFAAAITCGDKAPLGEVEHDLDHVFPPESA